MLCTERTGGQIDRGQQGQSYGWVSEWWSKLGVQTYRTELEIAICEGSNGLGLGELNLYQHNSWQLNTLRTGHLNC